MDSTFKFNLSPKDIFNEIASILKNKRNILKSSWHLKCLMDDFSMGVESGRQPTKKVTKEVSRGSV